LNKGQQGEKSTVRPLKSAIEVDYTSITELPGQRCSHEQLARLYHRYRFALQYSAGKDVLEVGCGAGPGLGYLAKLARRVVGGDFAHANLQRAQEYYKEKIPLVRMDGQSLPFADGSFDMVLLFEAIYYLPFPEKFIEESHRVLRKSGALLICTVNREWADFNPSAFSTSYLSASELAACLRQKGFDVEMFGAFLASTETFKEKRVSALKRSAVKLGLIPKNMKNKGLLKRIFFGRLEGLPPEVTEGLTPYTPPLPILSETPQSEYKIIYAVGLLR
jgi:ubiquinone/menaquinone biosynthesis C-methylase UbiE